MAFDMYSMGGMGGVRETGTCSEACTQNLEPGLLRLQSTIHQVDSSGGIRQCQMSSMVPDGARWCQMVSHRLDEMFEDLEAT